MECEKPCVLNVWLWNDCIFSFVWFELGEKQMKEVSVYMDLEDNRNWK